ncbi:glucose-1-phosphate adenylyltransferase family protein [Litorihabitans aurantiacus]|uniref:Glucose-1-phosphate adenylyltransferase n=1 Tax=Litorihabitans aurantiacus TaxID=1930061 RepID=A0AA37USG6_9MICO|nr:sugar phosphate nucleotidyltransferase [Litorihabitans aurantiacus]GMA30560.1 glucose-1-phosphate adenylyltransferase [Litorihabitans aurantiacus]
MTRPARPPRTLCLILAGGQGSRLGALTEHRVKPALRVAGSYRLIDVALSTIAHSRIDDVWIAEQYLPHSLNAHLGNGRPWDLDRVRGGLQVLAPFEGGEGEGFAHGNSDTLWRHHERLREFGADCIIVLSADHLYTLDLLEVLATHVEHDAELTMVTTRTDEDPSSASVVQVDARGRVTDFTYKPEEPDGDLVAAEVFCFDAALLVDALEELHARPEGLGDYGEDLVPWFVERGRTVEHRLEGYWMDMGTPERYWRAHMQLIDGDGARLDDPRRPVRTAQPQLPPARVEAGAVVVDSLLAAGSRVAGEVRRSVVGPGVVIESGAVVEESVLLDDVHVGAGVHVRRCIVDDGVRLTGPSRRGGSDEVTVVGR